MRYWFKRSWSLGDKNPLKWMHDTYRTARRPDAPSSRANKALIILRASSEFSERQALISNPQLMNDMAVEVSSLLSASRLAPLNFEFMDLFRRTTVSKVRNQIPAPGFMVDFTSSPRPEWGNRLLQTRLKYKTGQFPGTRCRFHLNHGTGDYIFWTRRQTKR